MIQNEAINGKIEKHVKEVLVTLGSPDSDLSVEQVGFEVREEPGGQIDLHERDGTWKLTFSDGSTRLLSLTFEERYDADSQNSEKLKAAIMRCLKRAVN